MCPILHLPDRDIENLGELRAVMRQLVKHPSYEKIPEGPDWCLCSVDLEATAKANGLKVLRDEYGNCRLIADK